MNTEDFSAMNMSFRMMPIFQNISPDYNPRNMIDFSKHHDLFKSRENDDREIEGNKVWYHSLRDG